MQISGYADSALSEPLNLGFEDSARLLATVAVSDLDDRYGTDYNFGEFFADEVAPRLGLRRSRPALREAGEVFENLSVHTILWLLAQNSTNLDVPLVWNTGLAPSAEPPDYDAELGLSKPEQFLIVTEGSSDAAILEKAFRIRRPDISDFFYFVDADEGFPFTGTGNLHRFCQGLARIGLINKTIVVYDNDAVGLAQWKLTASLRNLPSNIRPMKLPDLPTDSLFPTIGPARESMEDINGRAASIEAYLDLSGLHSQRVRWTSYVKSTQSYQGEFEEKATIVKDFLHKTDFEPWYDFSKLDSVLSAIVHECKNIYEGRP
jgi:hypothetical protein